MITVTCKGDFDRSRSFLKRLLKLDIKQTLDKYAQMGLEQLKAYTPKDSGETADSWGYEIEVSRNRKAIVFTNDNINDGVPIAIILQYGHGTRNGGYVQGIDYINPALDAIFQELADEAWEEVTRVE